MADRVSIVQGTYAPDFQPVDPNAAVQYGVSKPTFLGRTIEIRGQEFNCNSLVKFLNNHPNNNLATLKEGWLFGYCGEDEGTIKALFEQIYPTTPAYELKIDEVARQLPNIDMVTHARPLIGKTEQEIKDMNAAEFNVMFLTDNQNSDPTGPYRGLVLVKELVKGKEEWILYICTPQLSIRETDKALGPLMDVGIKKLAELSLDPTLGFNIKSLQYSMGTQKPGCMMRWQLANGRQDEPKYFDVYNIMQD